MDKPKFVYVTYIIAPPEKVWEALTSPKFTRQYWFETDLESDWKVGSKVIFRKNGEIWHDDTILRSEPPRVLSYTFRPLMSEEMRSEKASRVLFEIDPIECTDGRKGSRLTVTHDEFPAGSKVYPRVIIGWPEILSSLKSLLETGKAFDTV
jgi:uncharacterized protein YndB with AHSA1/START domain